MDAIPIWALVIAGISLLVSGWAVWISHKANATARAAHSYEKRKDAAQAKRDVRPQLAEQIVRLEEAEAVMKKRRQAFGSGRVCRDERCRLLWNAPAVSAAAQMLQRLKREKTQLEGYDGGDPICIERYSARVAEDQVWFDKVLSRYKIEMECEDCSQCKSSLRRRR